MLRRKRPTRSAGLRTALLASLGCAALCLCSCRSGRPLAANDPFAQPEAAPTAAGVVKLSAAPQPEIADTTAPATQTPPAGPVSQVAWNANDAEQIEHSDYQQSADPGQRAERERVVHAEFTAAEPRQPVVLASGQVVIPGGPLPAGTILPSSPVRHYPDEYLCDGGDRGLPVHYGTYHRLGLETEDTIAEFTDHTGQSHMKPTNKVCVYAPRFGAMRTVSASQSDFAVDKLASAADIDSTVGLRARTATLDHVQRQAPHPMRMRSRASGFEIEGIAAGVDQATAASSHTKLLNAYEDLNFVQTGRFIQSDEARLAAGMQAAFAWSRDQNPIITASTVASQEVRARFSSAELVHLEDLRVKGDLRIVKLADQRVAVPGDVLTFTIRYDNVGDHELTTVRIVDNLTPRLEYVEDSATSDRDGQLVVEDNGEGSVVLTFELEGPLPGRTGGVLTFKTRVR